jgi:hypothetical protein
MPDGDSPSITSSSFTSSIARSTAQSQTFFCFALNRAGSGRVDRWRLNRLRLYLFITKWKNNTLQSNLQNDALNSAYTFGSNLTYLLGGNVSLAQLYSQVKNSVVVIQDFYRNIQCLNKLYIHSNRDPDS